MDPSPVELLQRFQHWTVVLVEKPLRNVQPIVAVDSDQVRIECCVMNLRKWQAIGDDRLPKALVLVGDCFKNSKPDAKSLSSDGRGRAVKTVSANLLNHLGDTVLSIAKCIKITLQRHQPEIIDIAKANPGSVTTKWAHGFKTGDVVRIVRVRGMTEVDDTEYVVTVTSFHDLHHRYRHERLLYLYRERSHKAEAYVVLYWRTPLHST